MARTATPGSPLPGDPRRRWIVPAALPGALVVPWLAATASDRLPDGLRAAALAVPAPALILALAVVLLGASFRDGKARLRVAALVFACAAAPVALVYPWAVATRFPGAVGDVSYFLGWLTRYPNFGPVNIEVLAGIAAVVTTGFLPALAAALFLLRAPRRALQAAAAVSLIAYFPVLVRLDVDLLRIADIWFDQFHYRPVPVYGPAIRAMAVAAALALALSPALPAEGVSPPPPGSRPARR